MGSFTPGKVDSPTEETQEVQESSQPVPQAQVGANFVNPNTAQYGSPLAAQNATQEKIKTNLTQAVELADNFYESDDDPFVTTEIGKDLEGNRIEKEKEQVEEQVQAQSQEEQQEVSQPASTEEARPASAGPTEQPGLEPNPAKEGFDSYVAALNKSNDNLKPNWTVYFRTKPAFNEICRAVTKKFAASINEEEFESFKVYVRKLSAMYTLLNKHGENTSYPDRPAIITHLLKASDNPAPKDLTNDTIMEGVLSLSQLNELITYLEAVEAGEVTWAELMGEEVAAAEDNLLG